MRCKVCLKIVRHPAKKTKVLQVCGYCQKNQWQLQWLPFNKGS
jgi:hypothetical protein